MDLVILLKIQQNLICKDKKKPKLKKSSIFKTKQKDIDFSLLCTLYKLTFYCIRDYVINCYSYLFSINCYQFFCITFFENDET